MALLATTGLALTACGEAPPPPPAPTQVETPAANATAPAPATPAIRPKLSRQDLIDATARAASAYAEGQDAPADDPLVGQPFAVRIAFGCGGPSAPEAEQPGIAHWSWGPDRKTIRLVMQPEDLKGSALIAQAGAADTWEAIEGVWIPRPWMTSEGCPAVKDDPLQAARAQPPQTLALATLFEAGGSRIGRREGRAYRYTVRGKGDAPATPPAAGYRLLLEGRVEAFPNGHAIECRASGMNERPVCVTATRLDRVVFEGDEGTVLAEWRTD